MNLRFVGVALLAVFASCQGPVLLYSEEEMAAMGVKAYAEETGKHKVITGTKEAEMVAQVGRRIADSSGKDYEWEFKLLDAPDVVNAFALPGGKIAVYSGLLKVAPDADSLAAIMGHEVAHATLQHGNQRVSNETLTQIGITTAAVLLEGWEGGSQESKALVLTGLAVGTEYGMRLPFSRAHESEADEKGLEYLMRAGFDPEAAPKLWERMAELGSGGTPEFLSTHPSSERRAADLRKWIPEVRARLAAEKTAPAK